MTSQEPISPELVLVSPELRRQVLLELAETPRAVSANGHPRPAWSGDGLPPDPGGSASRTAFLPEYGSAGPRRPDPMQLALAAGAYTVRSLVYAVIIAAATIALVALAVAAAATIAA